MVTFQEHQKAQYLKQREEVENLFAQMGFASKRFSHAKEPETRRADSLRLVLNRNRSIHGRISDLEIKVDFYAESTVYQIFANCWSTRGCMAHRSHKDRLEQRYAGFNPALVKTYVEALMASYI